MIRPICLPYRSTVAVQLLHSDLCSRTRVKRTHRRATAGSTFAFFRRTACPTGVQIWHSRVSPRPGLHVTHIMLLRVSATGFFLAQLECYKIVFGLVDVACDDFWATFCKMVRPMLSDRYLVCLPCLCVTLVYCGETVRLIKMKLGRPTKVGLGPGHIVLDGNPAPPSKRDTSSSRLCVDNFRPMSVVVKRPDGLRCRLVRW